jgi:hypothetical protein
MLYNYGKPPGFANTEKGTGPVVLFIDHNFLGLSLKKRAGCRDAASWTIGVPLYQDVNISKNFDVVLFRIFARINAS